MLVIDLIGVLLALAVGIGGQLVLSDPLQFVFQASELPLLTPEDLPGSRISRELEILGGQPWSQQREFAQSMLLSKDSVTVVETDQYIVWYADPAQAESDWAQRQGPPLSDYQILAQNTEKNKPQSVLSCLEPGIQIPRECHYRALGKHWYTDVYFYSRTEEHLPIAEMQKLMERVDRLLMSAPDEPCIWFLCTNSHKSVAFPLYSVIARRAFFPTPVLSLSKGSNLKAQITCKIP